MDPSKKLCGTHCNFSSKIVNLLCSNPFFPIYMTCEHKWKKNKGLDSIRCFKCKWFLDKLHRAKCQRCYLEGCIIGIEEYFNTSLSTERNDYHNDNQENIDTLSLDERSIE